MYKDANFSKCETHMLTKQGTRFPAVCYSYESKSKLYDIILPQEGAPIFRINMRRELPRATHHEIDKFFNLNIKFDD